MMDAVSVGLPQERFRRDVNRLAFGMLILLAAWIVSFRVLAFLLRDVWSIHLNLLLNDVCFYLIAAPLYWLCLRSVPASPGPKTRLRLYQWAVYFLIGAFLTYSSALATNLLMTAVSAVFRLPLTNRLESVLGDAPLWQIFLYTVVIAPFGEEFLFRRCLCDRLRPYGEITAALLSAIAFAAFHTNVYQFAYAFLLGLLMAHLYLKTGYWLYTVAIHAAINFVFGFLSSAVQQTVGLDSLEQGMGSGLRQLALASVTMTYLSLIISLVGVGLALLIALRRKISFGPSTLPVSRGEAVRLAWLTPGAILLTVAVVLITVFLW